MIIHIPIEICKETEPTTPGLTEEGLITTTEDSDHPMTGGLTEDSRGGLTTDLIIIPMIADSIDRTTADSIDRTIDTEIDSMIEPTVTTSPGIMGRSLTTGRMAPDVSMTPIEVRPEVSTIEEMKGMTTDVIMGSIGGVGTSLETTTKLVITLLRLQRKRKNLKKDQNFSYSRALNQLKRATTPQRPIRPFSAAPNPSTPPPENRRSNRNFLKRGKNLTKRETPLLLMRGFDALVPGVMLAAILGPEKGRILAVILKTIIGTVQIEAHALERQAKGVPKVRPNI